MLYLQSMAELVKPTQFEIQNRSIFAPDGGTNPFGISLHNAGDLVPSLSPESREKFSLKYGTRSGANDYGAQEIGTLIDDPSDTTKRHIDYLAAVYERQLTIYTSTKDIPQDALVVPYLNSTSVETQEIPRWGLPAEMVDALKNKVSFHRLVTEAAIEGFEVPDHKIANRETYVQAGETVIKDAQEAYARTDLTNSYPLGLIVRLEDADGGYGSSVIKQEVKNGRKVITVTSNRDNEKIEELDSNQWREALAISRKQIYAKIDPNLNPEVVISRMIDRGEEPGVSLIFSEGTAHSLGWNEQLRLKGVVACVGTSTFQPSNRHARDIQTKYEGQSAEAFATFMEKITPDFGIAYNQLQGIANVDLMLPGPLESTLRKRLGKKPSLYVAECNPRWTNYTDAVMAGIGAEQLQPTISNMLEVVRHGVHTIDEYQPSAGIDPEKAREVIYQRDQALKVKGHTRMIVRMPTDPLGVILLGKKEQALPSLNTSLKIARPKLRNHKA